MSVTCEELYLNRIEVMHQSRGIEDIEPVIRAEMMKFEHDIKDGMTVAIAVGSRGIDRISTVVKTVAGWLKERGAQPFIVPSMGSHGGATGEGQKSLLEEYGITEEEMGVPIKSSMDTVSLGCLADNPDVRVYMDKNAYEADKVFAINRVKPHTEINGIHESGIVKMLVIGLGKQAQAAAVHEYLVDGLKNYIPKIAQQIIGSGKILGALGLVEDGFDKLAIIKSALPAEILDTDARLLEKSKEMMPKLPFKKADVLLVERMGKNISGTGMDTNVIGRMCIRGEPDNLPFISRICLFGLTCESHGNALGIGLADVIPRRLYDAVDWKATYENVLTSRFVERGFVPIVMPDDYNTVLTALNTCGHVVPGSLRLAYIKDTAHLDVIFVSDALAEELKIREDIRISGERVRLQFDSSNCLVSPFSCH